MRSMNKYLALFFLFSLPSVLYGQNSPPDSSEISQFHRYSGYFGIGFPFGVGIELSYRPVSPMAVSIGANMTLLIPNLLPRGRPSISASLDLATSSIKANGVQDGISSSVIILPAFGFDPSFYSFAFTFGSMAGSSPLVNWKFGAMLFLRESASTFFRRIMGLPLLSISLRLL
jgi:hypothetical protein